jgi:hypothetical protein
MLQFRVERVFDLGFFIPSISVKNNSQLANDPVAIFAQKFVHGH